MTRSANPSMPRFVILTHDWPFPHWDLMLEEEESAVLKSWRLLSEPVFGTRIPAEALPDHRKLYLDYEGPVSGQRGAVTRWEHGTYTIASNGGDELTFRLKGRKMNAELVICDRESGMTSVLFQLLPAKSL